MILRAKPFARMREYARMYMLVHGSMAAAEPFRFPQRGHEDLVFV